MGRRVWFPVVSGPLSAYSAGYGSWLRSQSYSRSAISDRLWQFDQLSRWLDRDWLDRIRQADSLTAIGWTVSGLLVLGVALHLVAAFILTWFAGINVGDSITHYLPRSVRFVRLCSTTLRAGPRTSFSRESRKSFCCTRSSLRRTCPRLFVRSP